MTTPADGEEQAKTKQETGAEYKVSEHNGTCDRYSFKRPRSESIEHLPAPVLPRIEEALKRPADEERSEHSATSSTKSHPTLPSPFPSSDRSFGEFPQQRPQFGPDGGFQRPPGHMHKQSTGSIGSIAPAGGRTPGTHQARQRTAVACRYCRKRKIRCTGISHDPNDPRCSNCRRLDQECIYAPVGAPIQGNYQRQSIPVHADYPRPGHYAHDPRQWPYDPHAYHQERHEYSGRQYIPPPPPPAQQYAYDNNYPSYVPPQPTAYGQFGRLKPETFAVYSAPELPPLNKKDSDEKSGGSPNQVASISNLLSASVPRDRHDDSMLSKLLN